jgi:uncharacterized protein (DUF362 family)
VKPSDTWASEEDKTAVTQGEPLRAVLECVKRFGPRELVVTGGAGAAETEDVFRTSGMLQVVREANVAYFDHKRPRSHPSNLSTRRTGMYPALKDQSWSTRGCSNTRRRLP